MKASFMGAFLLVLFPHLPSYYGESIISYMGFGMRKEVYLRKPKKVFSKIKAIYGEEMQHYTPSNSLLIKPELKLSDADRSRIKKRLKHRLRQEGMRDIMAFVVATLLTIGSLAIIVFLLKKAYF